MDFFGVLPSLYGVAVGVAGVVGYLTSFFIARRYSVANGVDWVRHLDIATILLIICGVVGARLLFVLYNVEYFSNYIAEIPQVWHGGWVWHGGFIAGVIALALYARLKKISFWRFSDIIVPGIAFAQALGRWGNFFNQEAYGAPTQLPWGIFIDSDHRIIGYESFSYFHPTFLYESLLDILIGVILCWIVLNGRRFSRGYATLLYVLIYSISRFFIEFLRIDIVPEMAGLRAPQWICIVMVVISVTLLSMRKKHVIVAT